MRTEHPEPLPGEPGRSSGPGTTTGSGAAGTLGRGGGGSDEDRMARVALTWLTEPGNRAVWTMVHAAGAVATLDRLLDGDIPIKSLRSAVEARVAVGDARELAARAL